MTHWQSPRSGPRFVARLVAVAALGLAHPADADWPMARHDPQRTGAAPGKSDVTHPVPYWRAYLGGGLQADQLLALDVNGDGQRDLVYVAGGQVFAKSPDDTLLWKSLPDLGITSIVSTETTDLDGDGNIDIVAVAPNLGAIVLASRTGVIEWAEPVGDIGTVEAVRVGDLTGDSLPEIVIEECLWCDPRTANPGFVYSFAGAGADFTHPKLLWTLPGYSSTVRYGVAPADKALTLFDAEGHGPRGPFDVLVGNENEIALLHGADGALLATAPFPPLTVDPQASACRAANLRGTPGGEEVVCIQSTNTYLRPPFIDVLEYQPGADGGTGSLQSLWSVVFSAGDASALPELEYVDPVLDLAGDGKPVVVFSVRTGGAWVTYVYDGLGKGGSPSLLASAPGVVVGAARVEKTTSTLLFTRDPSGTLVAWTFSRTPPALEMRWSLPASAGGPLTYPAVELLARCGISSTTVAVDLNGDGVDDLLANGPGPALSGYACTSGKPLTLASYTPPAGVTLSGGWAVPPIWLSVPQVAIVRTDGTLLTLDDSLSDVQNQVEFHNTMLVHVGGVYASGAWQELSDAPRVASLGGGKAESVLVSIGGLSRLDAALASWVAPPVRAWTAAGTSPTVVPGLDGNAPGIAYITSGGASVGALAVDGGGLWTAGPFSTTNPQDNARGDIVPVRRTLDGGAPALAVTHGSSQYFVREVAGADGVTLWDSPIGLRTSDINPLSVGKWNDAGTDDIAFQLHQTFVLNGQDGSLLIDGGAAASDFMPLLYDTNGDGTDEVLLQGGQSPVSLYSHDLSRAIWVSTDNDEPYPYGSMAACPTGSPLAGPVFVEGSLVNPARLKLTPLGGSGGPSDAGASEGGAGNYTTLVLAGGQRYSDETAAASAGNDWLGKLTSAAVHANLTGKGRPTAVVGSTDGWLYGVNPCDPNAPLDFAYDFGVPVGEAVFGDTDGDGRDEILVTSADGYLYDLKNENIAQPSQVSATTPDFKQDVQEITTKNTLWCKWTHVKGATGYEVAVATAAGKIISSPAWKSLSSATDETAVSGLPLKDAQSYVFAVRAIGAAGPSVDAVSHGVVVHLGPSGQADAGTFDASADASARGGDGGRSTGSEGSSGCGCRLACRSSSVGGVGALFGLCMLTVRRRSRRGR